MRIPSKSICPEGFGALMASAFSAILFALLEMPWIALLFWLAFLFSLHFFRDPERVPPAGDNLAASPADGTVVRIGEQESPFGEKAVCISIFMSVFNVHVNRSPVSCTVEAIRYFPGKFFNASLDKASRDNERCAWLLADEKNNLWCMVQIAGLVARRIVCRAEPGDQLFRGQRLGMIRFGSRVDLYLPAGYAPAVETGSKVFGGETIIARKKD